MLYSFDIVFTVCYFLMQMTLTFNEPDVTRIHSAFFETWKFSSDEVMLQPVVPNVMMQILDFIAL